MKYVLLTLISAMLLSISWPTYGVPFFIFFALVPLLMMEHGVSKFSGYDRKSWVVFGLSYLCFVIWNAVTTGWLYGSKNPDGSHSLMAVLFPVLVNSFLYALVFQCYHWYKNAQGTYWGLAFFIAIWMGFEKFHLSWELTWPWLNLGNAFSEYPKLIQWYDTLGATGGSFWILAVNIMIFYTVRIWEAGRKRKRLIINTLVVTALIALPMIISAIRYNTFDEKPVGQVNVLMLQPDLDPYAEKYSKDSIAIENDLLNLAGKNSTGKIDYYIAPETAIPGRGSISETAFDKSLMLNNIKDFLIKHPGSVFATGISSHRFYSNTDLLPKDAYQLNPRLWVESYNSAVQVVPGRKVEVYHKGKLVPGVEIFPYMNVLKPLLGNAMLNLGGTVASLGTDKERVAFSNPYNKGKLAPIICYESIYGEFVGDYVKKGANFLAIMTNDSWWGVTEGHKQLLSYARLRAIETRREIARAANSGISAHINAKGEITADTFYGDQTALFAKVNLYEGETFYVRSGDFLSRLCIFALGFLLFYHLIKRFQKRFMK
ncbi:MULTISPECIES: apolipoprotein N-acyltransferase [Chryseobacterium]|uniref:Apolipoprotein N-acyltransferase n=1 Tax=Chryseobacterium camelliae TaxID=1265445 RepID=A0ABU0TK84_9FLAO|nr:MULTISPECIES: apolipoprotein N-acyltransferase [Chryseobacterium]MDT3408732.1 apolipoprotein N-acyltransferase [Pseudacidovorax intermedius]MDQ1097416.1 apolipoprotein N-acyltransferase [Chryseobacterium camelliae]MDQ1101344.1 apolipoprotein N-acyltransferase [Chryseobacterium sp. SORGH_AS_1048]MDR6084789.1 apolipoprotein N-acyltransferase [Chryseobacterium sp. SORGH_AS_0909]MDR6129136.1 apolipoprotein N-acyltransferase [Chryseobacterium sp. SORGH_AS_1175]